MPWIALTLEVDADAAEAMSEALMQAGAQSVALEALERPRPTVQALLRSDEDADRLVREAAHAAGFPAAPPFTTRTVPDEDWVRTTQAQFEPLEVGARLWVGSELARATAGTRRPCASIQGLPSAPAAIRPRASCWPFSNERCAAASASSTTAAAPGYWRSPPPSSARRASTAWTSTRRRWKPPSPTRTRMASRCKAALPEALPAAHYDIVVSNILAQPLIVLAPLLAARTAPGGRLALAGILQSQGEEVAAAYRPWFDAGAAEHRDGWVLISGVRR